MSGKLGGIVRRISKLSVRDLKPGGDSPPGQTSSMGVDRGASYSAEGSFTSEAGVDGNSESAVSSSNFAPPPAVGLAGMESFGNDPEAAIEERAMKQKLASKSVGDQLEALRWLITDVGQRGQGPAGLQPQAGAEESWVEMFLPPALKLLASKHPEVKRLVLMLLVRHAESKAGDALMAINEVQKGLSDLNAHTRASSVKVLSSIRVRDVTPIAVVVLRSAVLDPHPLVRKAAVLGLVKLHRFNRDVADDLVSLLVKVLESEPTPSVLGAACHAHNLLCPSRTDLIHPCFRKLCKLAADMDEWGQVEAVTLLHRYARANFTDPNRPPSSPPAEEADGAPELTAEEEVRAKPPVAPTSLVDAFYEGKGPGGLPLVSGGVGLGGTDSTLPDDHRLLLRCTQPLLMSRNAAVVMAAASLHFDVAPAYDHFKPAKALVFCTRSSRVHCAYAALSSIASISCTQGEVFSPHIESFYVKVSDPPHVKSLKLDILTQIVREESLPQLLAELQAYLRDGDMSFVSQVVRALGRCAVTHPHLQDRVLKSLVTLSTHASEEVSSDSVQVVVGIIQGQPGRYLAQVGKLARKFGRLKSARARAGVIWLCTCHLSQAMVSEEPGAEVEGEDGAIGDASAELTALALDVLKRGARRFVKEEVVVKLQVLNACAKLHASGVEVVKPVLDYVLAVARCDASYGVRDRARFYSGLFGTEGESGEVAGIDMATAKRMVLASGVLDPVAQSQSHESAFTPGSLSHIVDHTAPGYVPLPDFALEPTNSRLRDPYWSSPKAVPAPRAGLDGPAGHGQPHQMAQASMGQVSESPLDNFYSDGDTDDDVAAKPVASVAKGRGGGSDSESYSYYSSDGDSDA